MTGLVTSRPSEDECHIRIHQIDELFALSDLNGLAAIQESEIAMLYSEKAMLTLFMDDPESAFHLCEKSLYYKPKQNLDACYALGCAGYCLRDYELALSSFEESLNIDPGDEASAAGHRVTLARLGSKKDREYIDDSVVL